jgi:hypothetical protein
MRRFHALLVASLATPLLATAALAQSRAPRHTDDEWLEDCRDSGDRLETFCEIREERMRAPRGSLRIDGRENGGIAVRAYDGDDVLIHARVRARARDERDARDIARRVRLDLGDGSVRADGPSSGRDQSWSVDWEVFVPRRSDLELETRNGPISVEQVSGRMRLDAVNGPVVLRGVGGDVHARTENGPLVVRLEGDRFVGEGLDAETRNGPVTIDVPDGYSARLETGTTNGPISVGMPITVQGRIGRRIETTLGRGGATVRAVTTNGPLVIRRDR